MGRPRQYNSKNMRWCEQCDEMTNHHGRKCNPCRQKAMLDARQQVGICPCGCGRPVLEGKKYAAVGCHMRVMPREEFVRRRALRTDDFGRRTGRRDNYIKFNGKHEHRYVMEQHLGRELTFDEVVHHIDGDKWNNDISNLQVMTRAEHIAHHRQEMVEGKRAKSKK